jgi:hypothetical protein
MHTAHETQAEGRKAGPVSSLVLETDLLDWFNRPSESAAQDGLDVAWTGQNDKSRDLSRTIQLHRTAWENPPPEAQRTSIDAISARKTSGPFLVAITIE